MVYAFEIEGHEADLVYHNFGLWQVAVELDDNSKTGSFCMDAKAVPKFVRLGQQITITINQKSNTFVQASVTELPSANNNMLKFRICGLAAKLRPKDAVGMRIGEDLFGDDETDDDRSEVNPDDIAGMHNFEMYTGERKSFPADIAWVPDDTVFSRIRRAIDKSYDLSKLNSNSSSVNLKPEHIDVTSGMALSAVNNATTQLSEPIRDIIICGQSLNPKIVYRDIAKDNPNVDVKQMDRILYNCNSSQKSAVLTSETNFVSIIQGPPGTGKTSTATCIICGALLLNKAVLLVAPSNTAVDNILRAVLNSTTSADTRQQLESITTRVCSCGQYCHPDLDIKPLTLSDYASKPKVWESSDTYCPEGWKEAFKRKYLDKQPMTKKEALRCAQYMVKYHKRLLQDKFKLVFATCNGCADVRFRGSFFDLLVIDKATQDTEPALLVPMLLLKISGRVTLLGDHKQLGPILQSRKAQSIGLDLSLFERLYNMHVPYTLLDTQYQMNPYIGDLVSSLCYDDQLKNGVTTDQRTLPLADNYPTKVSNNPVAFVNCFASEQYDRSMRLVTNQQEANCVVDAVVKL